MPFEAPPPHNDIRRLARFRLGGPLPLLWLAAAVVLVSGGLLVWALHTLRAQAMHEGERLGQSFAHVIEGQTSRTFQALDQRLQLVALDLHELEESGPSSRTAVQALLSTHAEQQPEIQALWISDAKGRIAYASDTALVGQSMAGDEVLQPGSSGQAADFSVAKPVYSRNTDSWLIQIARPVRMQTGNINGVLVASIDTAYFERIWRGLDLGQGGSIALLRQDGTLMARSPAVASALGKFFVQIPHSATKGGDSAQGTIHIVSPIDHAERLLAYRPLASPADLVVAVGQSEAEVLQAWTRFATVALSVWGLAAATVAVLCVLLGRSGLRRQRTEAGQLRIFERITDAFVALDTRWNVTYLNHRAEEILSRKADTLIGTNLWEALPLDAGDQLRTRCEAAMASRLPAHLEEYYPPLQRWLETRMYPSAQGMTLYFQDVSVRKMAEQALRSNELRYRQLFENSPQIMWVIAQESLRFLAVNDAAVASYGYSRDEFLQMTLHDIRPPEDAAQKLNYATQQRLGMHRHGLWRHRRKDASVMLVEIVSHSLVWDGQPSQLVLSTDVTEREKAQEALHVSDLALKAVSQGVLITGLDHRILTANDAFLSITGYAQEEVLGKTCNFLWGPETDAKSLAELQQCIQEEREYSGELIHYKKDGTTFWNDLSVAPVRSLQGTLSHFIGITRDISERKRAELAMQENKHQLQELSRRVLEAQEVERRRLARELHDELGQSLTAIKINLQSFGRIPNQSADELHAENVRIVDDVLQQVRSLALALRPSVLDDLGLVPALRWISEQTTQRTGLAVAFETHVDAARFSPDIETACFRITQEALTNVVRYANASHVMVQLGREGDSLILSIADNGRGFDFAAMRLRAQAGGSLGVLGMQERAALIGGALEIDSAPGRGSTVRLRCPWVLQNKENT